MKRNSKYSETRKEYQLHNVHEGGYVILPDRGHWFSLDFLARPQAEKPVPTADELVAMWEAIPEEERRELTRAFAQGFAEQIR